MSYVTTVGLEIHAELLTESKLFCGCRNDPNGGEPNEYICPVCVGYPGALPFLNRTAVEHVLRIGAALGGSLADETRFDRKHYFYPDIPKGYQISQYPFPLVSGASLLGVGVQRIHLEEDTAKSSHDVLTDASVIDFNRSGVPLMELVTDPVMHTSEEARRFGEMLQSVLRYLGVARARMEWGEMRVEVNISVSTTEVLGTKVEVKNLNSFKAVAAAIVYETKRQTDALERGESVVQETRGWNENTGKTFSQRVKETSEEYRYLSEPDLPGYRISACRFAAALKDTIPELPWERKGRYLSLGLSDTQADVLVRHLPLAVVFDAAVAGVSDAAVRLTANYLTSDVLQYAETHGDALFERVTVSALRELVSMLLAGELSSRGAKTIIALLAESGGSPREIASREGLFQESDEGVLQDVALRVIEKHASVASEYRSGKEQALQFLVGQVMRETKGSANPAKAQLLLKSLL